MFKQRDGFGVCLAIWGIGLCVLVELAIILLTGCGGVADDFVADEKTLLTQPPSGSVCNLQYNADQTVLVVLCDGVVEFRWADDGSSPPLVEKRWCPPGIVCRHGGYIVGVGFDTNQNSILDNDEVEISFPVCRTVPAFERRPQ